MTESSRPAERTHRSLPLFPLGSVLFPGLVLPLHIFEERYRLLISDLLSEPEPRRLGIVSIELGHEVGSRAARRLATVGCTAELHGVVPHDDGRYDVVTVGASRFRVRDVDDSLPYLRARVQLLPEEAGDEADAHAGQVGRLFQVYRDRLGSLGAELAEPFELPEDPIRLSYLIAAAAVLDCDEKQQLLEAPDATTRLMIEQDLLARENRLLRSLPTVPASQFIDGGVNPN